MLRERIREAESHTDDTQRRRRNTIAWLARAREVLEKGEYEICAGALHGAKAEVNGLLPFYARAA